MSLESLGMGLLPIVMGGLSGLSKFLKNIWNTLTTQPAKSIAALEAINRQSSVEDINKITAVFGGVELDMRDVTLDSDLVIECFTLFGGIDIRLPKNVKVEVNGLPIFGGVENKYHNDGQVIVYINHTTIFGGVDLL